MSNENKLQSALDDHITKFGGEVQSRFTAVALKAIDPTLVSLTFYVGDFNGERWNRPTLFDGSPNPCWPVGVEAPREPEERKKFFMDIKSKQYQAWIERVERGEFDGVPANALLSQPTAEPEPAKPEPVKPVEIVKTIDKVDKLVEENNTKGTPPPPKMVKTLKEVSKSPGTQLLRALDDYIASTDSPPEDQPDYKQAMVKLGNVVAEQQATIDKQSMAMKKMHEAIKGMALKVPEMIKAEILKKFA
jgi:hypothetical protein